MKIPMYFDFIQTGESAQKLNAIPLELSSRLVENTDMLGILEISDPCVHIEFVSDDYNGKFYYPIFWAATGPEYFESIEIPKIVLDKINKSQAKLLITNSYEGYPISDQVKQYILDRYSLSFENCVFLNGNKYEPDDYASIYHNAFEKTVKHAGNPHELYNKAYNLIFNKDYIRKHKFICLQRRPKSYRVALYTELYPYRHEGILTLGRGDFGTDFYNNFYNEDLFGNLYPKTKNKFKKLKLHPTLPDVYDVNVSVENPVSDPDSDKFYQSYLHVVAESFFEDLPPMKFFSEKVFKPVIYFQPFVMLNQYKTLSEFRDLGFETFPEIIDESYDDIKNDEVRFYKTVLSITDFLKNNEKTMSKMMKRQFPVFAHNFFNLVSRVNNQQEKLRANLILNLYT
jgi:hypothetical protein